ncbi:glucokinase [Polymorphobacter multimanifer]|uniref:Glucokinase n=1 Tax=Polymorphobacter multimanifer TaxID=1070431 RepID=A0A841L6P1_9SPHN|nr:glucokinase [Polymorphobacter multimanifer]MBB6228090.1 glucokinase [Polymorphobacter multimanifer]
MRMGAGEGGREIVAVDIGGTHARFAIATISAGRVLVLRDEHRFKCADDPGFAASWARYAGVIGRPLPSAAAIAVAGPVSGETIELVNNPWVLQRSCLAAEIGVRTVHLINDFAAVAHAVAQAPADRFQPICGPDRDLPPDGCISVIGPGTGLGVACLAQWPGRYEILVSEGGHSSFAVRDDEDAALASQLRRHFGRVSAERVVSGPGLRHIFRALAPDAASGDVPDDAALWQRAIAGHDTRHARALDRFCLCLGAFAGDMALVQGAAGVVLAGSLANRLLGHGALASFSRGFIDKGRFSAAMADMPVRLLTDAEPGLFGAAAAFASLHQAG